MQVVIVDCWLVNMQKIGVGVKLDALQSSACPLGAVRNVTVPATSPLWLWLTLAGVHVLNPVPKPFRGLAFEHGSLLL